MELWGLARALHVVAVVLWIGGVAMVTTVLLPAVRSLHGDEAMAAFARLERRFAVQSRWTTLLAGATLAAAAVGGMTMAVRSRQETVSTAVRARILLGSIAGIGVVLGSIALALLIFD